MLLLQNLLCVNARGPVLFAARQRSGEDKDRPAAAGRHGWPPAVADGRACSAGAGDRMRGRAAKAHSPQVHESQAGSALRFRIQRPLWLGQKGPDLVTSSSSSVQVRHSLAVCLFPRVVS